MSTPITPQQMIQSVLEALNESVKDIPEDRREEVKAKILDAFSAAMFKGPAENEIRNP
jgi:2-methylcitrate dehydratase PrpD